ncbi:MAG: GspE/PulE family protein [Patescibacteria group bacterium]
MVVQFKETKQIQRVKRLRAEQEERAVRHFAQKHGVGYVNLDVVPVNTNALRLIPEDRAHEGAMAAFNIQERKIALAIKSPHNPLVQEEVQRLEEKKFEVDLYMASQNSLEKAWSRYGDISYAVQTEEGVIDISSADVSEIISQASTLDKASKLLKEALASKQSYRVSKVIEIILYAAYALKASDIHIEPGAQKVQLRYRLDGILTNIITFDLETYQRILSRIKLTAGLKLNIRQNAQDGRFSIKLENTEIEVRTSTLPDAYGESIVMRILDPKSISVPMSELGMQQDLLERMRHEIARPNGLILNTGPTGSGKSTTLFSFIKKIRSPDIKIITIENPIEYHVDGVVQTQVEREKGYTFLTGLRSALRQDPDVIMVGEIRDEETAKIAANSALTGHLVFSTLHTNSAAGTFARLVDLGVSADTITVALNVAMAQRLVRRLCPHCRKEKQFSEYGEYIRRMITKILNGMPNKDRYIEQTEIVYEAQGCEECNGTGYSGRIGIFEVIFMDEELEQLLRTTTSEHDIQKNVRRQEVLDMREDGVAKIFAGTTTVEELMRVVDLD